MGAKLPLLHVRPLLSSDERRLDDTRPASRFDSPDTNDSDDADDDELDNMRLLA